MAAELVLQAKDVKIEECELALSTERHRVAIFQDERDRAIAERCKAEADLRAMEQLYSNLFGMLDRFRLPVDIKRKTSGNGNGKHRISGGGADDDCRADAAISISAKGSRTGGRDEPKLRAAAASNQCCVSPRGGGPTHSCEDNHDSLQRLSLLVGLPRRLPHERDARRVAGALNDYGH